MYENLPKSSQQHEQENLSIAELQRFIYKNSGEQFIIREEAGKNDYGVDIVLEIKHKETQSATNFRAHAQVKSIKEVERLKNGDVSFKVPVSNLNYLMNQSISVYFLYLENEEIFVWEWAREIFGFCQQKNIDITSSESQDTVSYHFTRKLDKQSLQEIHKFIKSVGETSRALNEKTLLFSGKEENQAYIVLKKGDINEIKDLNEITSLLEKAGIMLVNNGYAFIVNQALEQLPSKSKDDPEICLVTIYSKFFNGEVAEALGLIYKLKSNIKLLSEEKLVLFKHLEANIRFASGLISEEIYKEKISKIEENENSIYSLQLKFYNTWNIISKLENLSEIEKYKRELDTLYNKINSHSDSKKMDLYHLDYVLFELEALEMQLYFSDLSNKYKKGLMSRQSIINKYAPLRSRMFIWIIRLSDLRQKSLSNIDILMFSNIVNLYTQNTIRMVFISKLPFKNENKLMKKPDFIKAHNDAKNIEIDMLNGALKELSLSIKSLGEIKEYNLKLNNQILYAEILYLLDKKAEAISLLDIVINEADDLVNIELRKTAENVKAKINKR